MSVIWRPFWGSCWFFLVFAAKVKLLFFIWYIYVLDKTTHKGHWRSRSIPPFVYSDPKNVNCKTLFLLLTLTQLWQSFKSIYEQFLLLKNWNMDESLPLCIAQLVLDLMVQFEVVYSDGLLWLEHTCSRPAKHTWDFSREAFRFVYLKPMIIYNFHKLDTVWTLEPQNKIFVCVCE